MTVQRGSRYEYAKVDYIPVGYGFDKRPVLFYALDVVGTVSYTEYTWKDGDRMDLLSHEMYGSSGLWWVIAEHNPEIEDPLNVTPGTVLRIPRA